MGLLETKAKKSLKNNKKTKDCKKFAATALTKARKLLVHIINIGEAEIMDINNMLRSIGAGPSKGLSQSESANIRKNPETKDVATASHDVKTETVTITDTTSRLRQLSQTASQQPEVNSARVEQLRASIADGSYKVRPDVISSRLMSFETGLRH